MYKESEHDPQERNGTMLSEEIGFVSYLKVGGESDPQGWVCSTGATLHVCNSRDKFDNYRPVTGKHVSLITGGKGDVAGIGSVTLKFTSGQKVTLPEVAHVPSFVTNFLSVGRFTDMGFEVTIKCWEKIAMIYKNEKFVGNGCVRGGIFLLNVENDNHSGAEGTST